MIDIAKILSSPERDDEIRKLIVPKPWKHEWRFDTSLFREVGPAPQQWKCRKCKGIEIYKTPTLPSGQFIPAVLDQQNPSCPVPDPIPLLDWNLAMKMRDVVVAENRDAWTYAAVFVENYRIAIAMKREWTKQDEEHVKREAEWGGVSQWFVDLAQPHHYILAAILAGEE